MISTMRGALLLLVASSSTSLAAKADTDDCEGALTRFGPIPKAKALNSTRGADCVQR